MSDEPWDTRRIARTALVIAVVLAGVPVLRHAVDFEAGIPVTVGTAHVPPEAIFVEAEFFWPLDILADLVSIGTLCAFVAVCVGIMMLRLSTPHAKRPFRTPLVWFVAPAGVASCGLMMASLSSATWWRLLLWTLLGLAIYFAYGRRHAAPSKWKVQ